MRTSAIKILQYRQEESKGSSTMLISGWVVHWSLIWCWFIKERAICHIDLHIGQQTKTEHKEYHCESEKKTDLRA